MLTHLNQIAAPHGPGGDADWQAQQAAEKHRHAGYS
jgi:hypothetical protein